MQVLKNHGCYTLKKIIIINGEMKDIVIFKHYFSEVTILGIFILKIKIVP